MWACVCMPCYAFKTKTAWLKVEKFGPNNLKSLSPVSICNLWLECPAIGATCMKGSNQKGLRNST